MAAAFFPIIGVLLKRDAHAGIEFFEPERAGSHRVRPVLEAVRDDQDVIVCQAIGQVRVARVERHLDLVRVELLDVGDRRQRGLAAGLGVAAMIVQRVNGVVGIEFLAVGEFDALAKVEDPFFGAVLGFPASGEVGLRLAVLAPFDDAIEEAVADGDHDGIGVAADVDAVRRAAAAEAEAKRAAVLRRLRRVGVDAGQHARYRERRGAERNRAAHKLTPRNRALLQPAL